MGKAKHGPPPDITVAERRAEIAKFRIEGYSVREIAKMQGRKSWQVQKDIRRAIDSVYKDSVATWVQIHIARTELMWRLAYQEMIKQGKGHLFALDRGLAVIEAQGKLLGLPAEVREKLKESARNAGSEVDAFLGGVDAVLPEDDPAEAPEIDADGPDDDDDPDDPDDGYEA